ncbi:MAG: PD40 domain-containing protein [Flavobacteriales bacterium]|nr:PD40 domain-containing protein [Flavobacteriales bacterium]
MKLKCFFALGMATLLISSTGVAQKAIKPDKAYANKNYTAAITGYENNLTLQPDDYHSQLYLGKSYVNANRDLDKAIARLTAMVNNKENGYEALFTLGRAYHLSYQLDSAITTFSEFIKFSTDSVWSKRALRQIEMCNNAKELMAKPVNVTIKNLGDTINSAAPDYNAFVEQTESVMVFTSKRKKRNKADEPGADGYYSADIFLSKYQDDAWQKLKSQSNVSTFENEEIVGLSADGRLMFYNTDTRLYAGEMIISKRKTGSFGEPIWVENTINTKDFETTACITHNRQNFYYASDRDGGPGEFDIYWAKRLPDVNWGKSRLVGPGINTEYNELFPQLSPDEKTLYFSSEGHNSMGGYDLFMVEWDAVKRQWGPVQNLGYPINTTGDDMHISMNIDGTTGYISSQREDTRGGLDIYSVSFNDVETQKSVVLGRLVTFAEVDYNEYQVFNVYRIQGKNLKIPVEFVIQDKEMVFIKREKETLKPKIKYEVTYVLNVGGENKEYQFDELPENYPEYNLIDVKLKEVVNTNYVYRPSGTTYATKLVKNSFVDVYDSQNELVGTYSSNPNSGTFVLILEPGVYSVIYFADFYKEANSTIEIYGKSGFEPIIHKEYRIEYDGSPPSIHYSEIEK